MIGVAFNDMSKMLVTDYSKDNKVNFPVAFANREPVMVFLGLAPDARLSVPQMVFIDRKGTIRQQSKPVMDEKAATEENIRTMLNTLTKEAGSATSSGSPKATAKKKS